MNQSRFDRNFGRNDRNFESYRDQGEGQDLAGFDGETLTVVADLIAHTVAHTVRRTILNFLPRIAQDVRQDVRMNQGQGQGRMYGQGYQGQSYQGQGDQTRGYQTRTQTLPRNFKRSDDRVREEIYERILQTGTDVDFTDLDINVRNGEVTLTGTLASRQEKLFVEQITDSVLGVMDIKNDIRVQATHQSRQSEIPPNGRRDRGERHPS